MKIEKSCGTLVSRFATDCPAKREGFGKDLEIVVHSATRRPFIHNASNLTSITILVNSIDNSYIQLEQEKQSKDNFSLFLSIKVAVPQGEPRPLAGDLGILPHKMADGAVVCALCFRRETAGRQFVMLSMVSDAIAAHTLAGAGLVGAIAAPHVLFGIWAFGHVFLPFFKAIGDASKRAAYDYSASFAAALTNMIFSGAGAECRSTFQNYRPKRNDCNRKGQE